MIPLPYPRMVVADVHVHERNNKARIREVMALLERMVEVKKQYGVRSLIVCGDLFDKSNPLSVSTIVNLARHFMLYERAVIIVGNHDTPVRATTNISMLDIFSMVGVRILNDVTTIGSDIFFPYYADMPEIDARQKFDCVYMHKDIRELNKYVDEDYCISLDDVPRCKVAFNGHLHGYVQKQTRNTDVFIQCGAPFPTSWSDADDTNNFVWIQTSPDSYGAVPTNITCTKGHKNEDNYVFKRERDQLIQDVADSVKLNYASMSVEAVDIGDALGMLDCTDRMRRVLKNVVSYERGKVWSNQL